MNQTITCDVKRLKDFIKRGALVQHDWGDAQETACMMSALAGATSDKKCAAKGWPLWLSELGHTLFDNWPEDQMAANAIRFGKAVNTFVERGRDFDRAFRDIRLKAILPIALEAIGEGNEDWRVQCRDVVQWSIDHDGQNAGPAGAVKAARSAWAAGAARAVLAALAAEAAGAVLAALAAEAAGAAGTAKTALATAYLRITEATFEVLESAQ